MKPTAMADVVGDGYYRVVDAVQSSYPLIVLPVGHITPRASIFTVFWKIVRERV